MLKEAGLLPPRCRMHSFATWDSAHPSSIIAAACCEYTKAKTDKDKNDFDATRKEENMLIDNSRGVHWDLFSSLWSNILLCLYCDQLCNTERCRKWMDLAMKSDSGWNGLQQWRLWCWFMRFTACCEKWQARGGRVFVETYFSVIYHTTTPPPTFFHWLVCELDTSHGANIMDNVAGECTRARG